MLELKYPPDIDIFPVVKSRLVSPRASPCHLNNFYYQSSTKLPFSQQQKTLTSPTPFCQYTTQLTSQLSLAPLIQIPPKQSEAETSRQTSWTTSESDDIEQHLNLSHLTSHKPGYSLIFSSYPRLLVIHSLSKADYL